MPTKAIPKNDYMYLWMSNDYEYHLVVEDGELRIYSYDYWSEDTILSYHEWEDWYGYLRECFEWMNDCFAIDAMRYSVLNIEWKETFDIAKEIINWADENMTEDLSYFLVENNDLVSRVPSSNLINLIERGLGKKRTYCYYK